MVDRISFRSACQRVTREILRQHPLRQQGPLSVIARAFMTSCETLYYGRLAVAHDQVIKDLVIT